MAIDWFQITDTLGNVSQQYTDITSGGEGAVLTEINQRELRRRRVIRIVVTLVILTLATLLIYTQIKK